MHYLHEIEIHAFMYPAKKNLQFLIKCSLNNVVTFTSELNFWKSMSKSVFLTESQILLSLQYM